MRLLCLRVDHCSDLVASALSARPRAILRVTEEKRFETLCSSRKSTVLILNGTYGSGGILLLRGHRHFV